MTYLAIGLTAFLVSGLTLFSGFGLGTVLMPAFALFFPLPVAIAATAALPEGLGPLVAAATLAAFAGAFLGARLLKKVTLKFVQLVVAAMMVVVGAGLAVGLL